MSADASSSKTVESTDVIRLILQYLKESNLRRSLQCLQEESSVALNAVDSIDSFESDIMNGRWDVVLQTIGSIRIPDESLHLLYEQVVCELLELQEIPVATLMLRETAALQSLKVSFPLRFRRLNQLASSGRTHFDPKELYEGTSKEKKRLAVSKALIPHIQQAPPARLLALIGMALKWQEQQGLLPPGEKYDLFKGIASGDDTAGDQPVDTIVRSIKFGVKTPPQCVAFSSDGRYLVTGSADGLIEVWDWITGKLALDLEYQKKECFMVHESAVLALAFSADNSLIASGCKDGFVKIWKLFSGQCIKKFEKYHQAAISCLAFHKDNTQVLTGSFDHTIRLLGLKSGKIIKEFRGHSSYINSVIFNNNHTKIISGSSDGQVKIWDYKATDCLFTLSPPPPIHMNENLIIPVYSVFLNPKTSDFTGESFFVCTRTNTLYLMNLSGQLLKRYSSGKKTGGDFVAACVSPHGRWIYAVGEDHTLYTFDGNSSTLEGLKKIHDQDVVGLIHHPSHSLLASYSFDGNVHLLQP